MSGSAVFAVVALDFADLHHLGEVTRIRSVGVGNEMQ